MADRLLEVEDGPDPLQGMERPPGQLAIADADQAPALGAEERLDDDVAPQLVEGRQGRRRRLAGPGRRDRESRRARAGPASDTCRRPPRSPGGD